MPKRLTARTVLWLGLPALLFAASCGTAFGAFKLVRADGDRIEVLGSGDNVSVLITTGRTEVLIATGDDRAAFGNAYGRVALTRRSQPDILLVAGVDRSLNVPTVAINWFADATAFAIHPVTGDADLGELDLLPIDPIRFTLNERVSVVVETRAGDGDGGDNAWRAVIERGDSRVAVISAFEHTHLFAWPDPVSVLVVAGAAGNMSETPVEAKAIIGSSATIDSPDRAESTDKVSDGPEHVVPVRPGDVATATFVESGVKLTSDGKMHTTDRTN